MKNDVRGVVELIGEFGTLEAVAIEACCSASNFAFELRRMTDWDVRQVHPGYVAQLRECKDKTRQRCYSGDCQALASVALLSNRHSGGDDSVIQRARTRLLLGINEQGSQKVLKGRTDEYIRTRTVEVSSRNAWA